MKAVRMIAPGRPLELQEIPFPTIGEEHVLVRVRAAGICHSDVHYRAGRVPVRPLPMTLGHEVAGVVEQVGARVVGVRPGDRVCLHYLLTCGRCPACRSGDEQFCVEGSMLGHYTDGGYAEYITVPARNAVPLPAEIPFEHGAVMMCSSSTALHALRKSRIRPGETIAVFGAGGLGMSAIQLAKTFGALDVYAIDIREDKLALAAAFGAIPIDAHDTDSVAQIKERTGGRGVDVALEMIGSPPTMRQAIQSLAPLGRAVMVGLSHQPLEIDVYWELLGREAEVIGSNDHLLPELYTLVDYARRGLLDLTRVITRTVPLHAGAINAALDDLERFGGGVRTVIVP
jgi:D-arabinose 1-dehydrogenase-like Zn-dependent alcohol dehydrogenase